MQKSVTAILIIICCFSACRNKNAGADYIDVAGYLKRQVHTLDSLGYNLLAIRKVDDRLSADTSIITAAALQQQLAPFLSDALSRKQLARHFKETVFADAGLLSITLTYLPKNDNTPFQRVDVYIKPSDGSIARVYAAYNTQLADTLIHTQLLWNHNRSCTLITSRTLQQMQLPTVTETISWQF